MSPSARITDDFEMTVLMDMRLRSKAREPSLSNIELWGNEPFLDLLLKFE